MSLNLVLWLLIIGGVWVLRILYSFRLVLILLYVLIALPLISLVLVLIQTLGMKFFVEIPQKLVEKRADIFVRVNTSIHMRIPCGTVSCVLQYKYRQEKKYKKIKYSFVPGFGDTAQSYVFVSEYASEIEFRLKKLVVSDVFGIWRIRKSVKELKKTPVTVDVLPMIAELPCSPVKPNPNVMVDSEKFSDVKSGDDASELFGIREYQSGDRINRVHWKLTAKNDQLMVKEFGLPIDCSVLILVNQGDEKKMSERINNLDFAIGTALSISRRMLEEAQEHVIAWYDTEHERIERVRIIAEEDFYLAAGELLRCGCLKKTDNVPMYYYSEFEREQYSNIFYVTAEKDPFLAFRTMEDFRKSAWLTLIGTEQAVTDEMSRTMSVDGVIAAGLCREEPAKDLEQVMLGMGGATWKEAM